MSLPAGPLIGIGALGAYLVGSVPFGLLAGYAVAGIDIRTVGSGNIGATNAARAVGRGRRSLGFAVFLAVFLLDGLKGAGPVLVMGTLAPEETRVLAAIVGGAGAVAGHMFSLFLRFRGGKGVAVGCGVMAALAPLPTLAAAGVFVLVLALSRFVSLSSMAAALSLPGFLVLFNGRAAVDGKLCLLLFMGLVALAVIVQHRTNIKRLVAGTEHRLGGVKGAHEKE